MPSLIEGKTVLKSIIKRRIGPANLWRFRVVAHTFRSVRTCLPPQERTCTVCGYEGVFDPSGWPVRPESACPRCHSRERHRLLKLWLDANADRVRGRSVLHFAAEGGMETHFRALAGLYRTADLMPGRDLVLDIEDIALPDASVDVIVCSHVLEHVDDRKAMPEFRRVLSPGGLALVMIPMVEGWSATYEDSAVRSPEARELHYGQDDHVRMFGADFRARAASCGLDVAEFTAVEPDVLRHGLSRGEKVFLLTPRAS